MASYMTEAEATAYFVNILNTEAWDDASSPDREAALNMATVAMDRLNYRGEKNDPDQDNQFPRGEDTVVPDDIKEACADIALRLLDGVDPEIEFENLSMVSQGYSNVRSTYDRSVPPEHQVAGILSIVAWRKMKPYLRDHLTMNFHRTS
jgi:hypothetical protein